jgi:hypothetical protein
MYLTKRKKDKLKEGIKEEALFLNGEKIITVVL